jgi:hypothetical protein
VLYNNDVGACAFWWKRPLREKSFHIVANRRDGRTMVPFLRPKRKFWMKSRILRTVEPILILALFAAAVCFYANRAYCQSNEKIPIPEYYGTYAVVDGKLVKLDADQIRTVASPVRLGQRTAVGQVLDGKPVATSNIVNIAKFTPNLKIVVFSQASGLNLSFEEVKEFHIRPLVFIRNVTVNTGWPSNVVRSGREDGWDTGEAPEMFGVTGGGLFRSLNFLLKPMPGHPEMVIAELPAELRPGVYKLVMGPECLGCHPRWCLFSVGSASEAETAKCADAVVSYAMSMENVKFTRCGETISSAAAPTKPAATAPAPPPAPVVAAKTAGVVRIGVVKIKDMSGQSLPTDNLRLNLINEIARHQHEAVPLDTEGPHPAVESEARSKQCDYIIYTVSTQVKEPNSGGLPPASLPKGVVLDPAKSEALTHVTLYKVGETLPELKDLPLAADAGQFAVDAVMSTFVMESDRVDQQIAEDAHPKPASKSSKAPAKPGTSSTKPH